MKQQKEIEIETATFNAESHLDPTDINILIDWLSEVKNKGATLLSYRGYSYDGDSEFVEIKALFLREETDEEEFAREEAERQRRESFDKKSKERSYNEYLRLKKLFENENL